MNGKPVAFIDTNIWVYAALDDGSGKHQKALAFLEETRKTQKIVCSVQVVNELHNVLERKYGFAPEVATGQVEAVAEVAQIVPLTFETYRTACSVRSQYAFSFWDGLVVASAVECGAAAFFSEDMQDELNIGEMVIRNPIK